MKLGKFNQLPSIIFGVFALGTFNHAIAADQVLTIAASPTPHAEILKQVQPMLKKQGIDLQIKIFNDYILPNMFVSQNKIDANFFQHLPYLEDYNQEHGTNLVELVGVEIEPMGVYVATSTNMNKFAKSKALKDLPKGIKVAVPNDPTNEGRALLLLQDKGLITINPKVKYPTKADIIKNPYNLNFVELEAPMLPRMLLAKQVDLAVINSNFALGANLNPVKDSVFIEGPNSPYVNIIAIRKEECHQPDMQKLAQAMKSQTVKDFIQNKYKGAVVYAFSQTDCSK